MSRPDPVRVSLATASARPDVPAIVVEPASGSEDRRVRLVVDGETAADYRLERGDCLDRGDRLDRGDAQRLVIADDSDPPTRIAAVVRPSDAPGPRAADHRRAGIERLEVLVDGWRFEVEVEAVARAALRDKARRGRSEARQDGPVEVRAIIPGVVLAVSVAPGDRVAAGQQLLVVEAMKMQNELRSPKDGVVQRVTTGLRQTIEVGDLLVVIE